MSTEYKLADREDSHLIKVKEANSDIVIGAPHHAPKEVTRLPCKDHPDSDENAGYLAKYLAEKLDASLIIAVNAEEDYNKNPGSDYIEFIKDINPKILLEIHGHGGRKAKKDIEISTGSKKNEKWSIGLSKLLKESFQNEDKLNKLSISGKWDEIYFTAKGTKSIKAGDWIGLHIELPSRLRLSNSNDSTLPPEEGYIFCDHLAEAVERLQDYK